MGGVIHGRAYSWGALTMLGALAVVLTAIGFEVLGGFVPCALCLQERWAYYAGVPAMFVALILLSAGWPRLAALLMVAVALGFLANAGLGVYHAGAEWGFWPGPETCGGGTSITGSASDLLKGLQNTHVIRCDQAAGRFLGLSFAGWNVVASIGLFATGLLAAAAASHSRDSGNWARA